MSGDIERFIKIQALSPASGKKKREWRAIPLGMRVRVWEMTVADAVEDEQEAGMSNKRYIFHIGFLENVVRGCLVTYLTQHFTILSVSDSTRLRGLELHCAPAPIERAADFA